MYRVVLWRRDAEIIFGIGALQSRHLGNSRAPRQERIFSIGLLPAAPSWIAKDVQTRRPEIQPAHDARMSFTPVLHMLNATLNSNLAAIV